LGGGVVGEKEKTAEGLCKGEKKASEGKRKMVIKICWYTTLFRGHWPVWVPIFFKMSWEKGRPRWKEEREGGVKGHLREKKKANFP